MTLRLNGDTTKVINITQCSENIHKEASTDSYVRDLSIQTTEAMDTLQAMLTSGAITQVEVIEGNNTLLTTTKYTVVNNISSIIRDGATQQFISLGMAA